MIVSTKEMLTGAVKGPYGGAGLNVSPTGGHAPETTRLTLVMCAAAAWICPMIVLERSDPAFTAVPPVAPASCW